jgi:NAD(P)-dependent dehydrogenase (short-subunit alcohol dehydrogenase family)
MGYWTAVKPDTAADRPSRTPSLVAVVNATSEPLGLACAQRFAARGVDVALLHGADVDARAAVDAVTLLGRRALSIEVDSTHAGSFEWAVRRIESRFGPIEIWVNLPYDAEPVTIGRLDVAEVSRVTERGYLGPVYGTCAALRRMRGRNRGVVINVGSSRSLRPAPRRAAGSGALSASRAFHDALRAELLQEESAVQIVQIYLDDSPAAVAARAIVAAAERPRRQRIVGTRNRLVAQVNKFTPGLLDHLTATTAPPRSRPTRAVHRRARGAAESSRPLLRTVERSLVHATHAVSSRAREIVSDWGR